MRRFQLLWILSLLAMSVAVGCRQPPQFDFSSHEIERLQLLGTKGIVSSTHKLNSGELYSVLVYGIIHFAPDPLASMDAQHKYSLKNRDWELNKSLLINGVPAVAGLKSDTNPSTYIFYLVDTSSISNSQVATFTIDDNRLNDNWGQLDIRIYRGFVNTFPSDLPLPSAHRNPVAITVDANQGWQRTGIQINAGDSFRIVSVTGVITDGKKSFANGVGLNSTCRAHPECCGPLPDSPESGLIARVGEAEPIFIGSGNPDQDIVASAGGELQLSVNDCGDGLMDNSGQLTVQVMPKEQ